MSNELSKVFDDNFKFQINQEARHRGDTKAYTADMGLLILNRVIAEGEDDDNKRVYERHYHCRMIRFSGSGEIQRFSEKELMTIKEYEEKKLKDDTEREQMRGDAKRVEKEIMEMFEITKDDYVYLKKDNVADKTKRYRMSGFSTMDGIIKLLLRESLITVSNADVKRESAEVTSKEDFEKVSTDAQRTGSTSE